MGCASSNPQINIGDITSGAVGKGVDIDYHPDETVYATVAADGEENFIRLEKSSTKIWRAWSTRRADESTSNCFQRAFPTITTNSQRADYRCGPAALARRPMAVYWSKDVYLSDLASRYEDNKTEKGVRVPAMDVQQAINEYNQTIRIEVYQFVSMTTGANRLETANVNLFSADGQSVEPAIIDVQTGRTVVVGDELPFTLTVFHFRRSDFDGDLFEGNEPVRLRIDTQGAAVPAIYEWDQDLPLADK